MCLAKHCTAEEPKLVKYLHKNSYTQSKISKIIKRYKKCVFTALKPSKKFQLCGRPRKTTSQNGSYIEILSKRALFKFAVAIQRELWVKNSLGIVARRPLEKKTVGCP